MKKQTALTIDWEGDKKHGIWLWKGEKAWFMAQEGKRQHGLKFRKGGEIMDYSLRRGETAGLYLGEGEIAWFIAWGGRRQH